MAAAALLLLAGCSSGEYSEDDVPTSPPGPTTSAPATTASSTTTTVTGDVTIRAVVAQTLASARVVVLAEQVGGFANVALTTDTEIVRANGAAATLNDIAPRATIEATGRLGAPGTLLARRVVLL